jgi:hypothetical protein
MEFRIVKRCGKPTMFRFLDPAIAQACADRFNKSPRLSGYPFTVELMHSPVDELPKVEEAS